MRKSTLFVLAIFFAATVFGQYTQNQTMGTANTLVSVPANGGLRAALINRTFTDTTAANSHPIKTYPFAQIGTTGDGNMWVRNYLATGWVLLGGGTSPSGTFWKVGGNMFPVSAPTRDIGTDATYGGAVGLMTNGVVRAIVPNGGFVLDNDTTSNKIFTWNPSTKDWGYANWNNSGGGGSSSNPNAKYGLYFPGYEGSHLLAKDYYPVEVDMYYPSSVQFWAKVDSSGYLLSDGYGGNHLWLFGVTTGATHGQISGNIYSHYVPFSFVSWDLFRNGTTHHLAATYVYEDSAITTYVDGVPSSQTTMNVPRWTPSASGSGNHYLGGSDHQNFRGTIFYYAANEGSISLSAAGSNYIGDDFLNTAPGVTVMYDMTKPVSTLVADQGNTYYGSKYDGLIHYGQGADNPPNPINRDSVPYFVQDSIYQSPYDGSITPAPSGAKIYDFFERTDQVPSFFSTESSNGVPTIDSTQGGTLGRKPYTYNTSSTSYYAGIINTRCYFSLSNAVTVTGDSNDQDVRLGVEPSAFKKSCYVEARKTDANNRVYAHARDDNYIILYQVVAGVQTSIGSYVPGITSFNELKLIVSGSTAEVYTDGTLRITGTISGVPSSNNSGFGSDNVFTRIKSFKVY